ncbi:MAG: hypothetical protein V1831_01805, partial [Candidatus Woesearchaeota archaeon]
GGIKPHVAVLMFYMITAVHDFRSCNLWSNFVKVCGTSPLSALMINTKCSQIDANLHFQFS